MQRAFVILLLALCPSLFAQKAKKAATPPPTKPPLEAVDITKLPEGATQLDLFLLMGQSNMKGRGVMPEEPKRAPRIVMMHLKDDQWYLARHPLHLTGDAKTFQGHDNAGCRPRTGLCGDDLPPRTRSCHRPRALRGRWIIDQALAEGREALRGGTAPSETGPANHRAGESPHSRRHLAARRGERESAGASSTRRAPACDDRSPPRRLALPELPFIACTIGEMKPEPLLTNLKAMNEIQLALPKSVPHTACVDARDLKTHIGDAVHFDTAAQNEIGKRFAAKFIEMSNP
jgi:hypothetical protein